LYQSLPQVGGGKGRKGSIVVKQQTGNTLHGRGKKNHKSQVGGSSHPLRRRFWKKG